MALGGSVGQMMNNAVNSGKMCAYGAPLPGGGCPTPAPGTSPLAATSATNSASYAPTPLTFWQAHGATVMIVVAVVIAVILLSAVVYFSARAGAQSGKQP
jgi:hypothetical protein